MARVSWIVTVFVLVFNVPLVYPDENEKPWSIIKYIKEQGYPAETHKIETKDGYILDTYRIPHGKFSNKANNNVILLCHGMGGSAENFIMLGPDDGLAFMLADRGFDVWLFNARGTLHCRKHKSKNASNFRRAGFWNFSWHEIGVHDVTANIDYILEKTRKKNLLYVGHSQGCTSYLVMTSVMPEYNQKIRAAGLLAPAALLNFTENSFIKLFSRFYPLAESIIHMFNYYELLIPNSPALNGIIKRLCMMSRNFQEICRDIISLVGGQDSGLMNLSIISTAGSYSPSGFATRQLLHYVQIVSSGGFKQYDHGRNSNIKEYNNTAPPEYNLNNSVANVALFVSNGDNVVPVKATTELSKLLPNVSMIYEIPYHNFNHLDYVLAYNAKTLVYEPLYDFLKQYLEKK